MTTCLPCGVGIDCVDLNPLDQYSLQGPRFFYVLNCPPGYDCKLARFVQIDVCGRIFSVTIPASATAEKREQLIQDMLNRASSASGSCPDLPCIPGSAGCQTQTIIPTPETNPGTRPRYTPPPVLYFSKTVKIKKDCIAPNTGSSTFELPAGTFIGLTQAEADLNAYSYALRVGGSTPMCIVPPGMCPCVGEASNFQIRITGGKGPFTPTIVSGHLPNGMTLTRDGLGAIKLTGTAVTPGRYQARIRVMDIGVTEGVSYWEGTITISALAIGFSSQTMESMLVPAVNSTVIVRFQDVTNLVVGDIVSVATVSGGYNSREIGTFEVMAIDNPDVDDVTLKNLTVTPGTTASAGSAAYWDLGSLPNMETGVDYLYQLTAVGGSGSYSWKITAGSLPTGLVISSGGLISGTPSGLTGSSFTVQMIDNACTTADKTFFTPIVSLVGRAETTTATIRGFDGFDPQPFVLPKRYMIRSYFGTMTGNDAAGNPAFPDEAGSFYFYGEGREPSPHQYAYGIIRMSGVDQINESGRRISTASIKTYTSCPSSNVDVSVIDYTSGNSYSVPGWCFQYDTSESYAGRPTPTPVSCGSCNYPLLEDPFVPLSNDSSISLFHGKSGVNSDSSASLTTEGLVTIGVFDSGGPTYNPPFVNAPPNLGRPNTGSTMSPNNADTAYIAYKHSYTVTLLNEYTEEMALNNATVQTSSGLTALNNPRVAKQHTTDVSWTSIWTDVEFDLKFRNLVFGQNYVASVTFETGDHVKTVRNYSFTAAGTTHKITDDIPTPAIGGTITAKTPTVAYAP